MCDQPGQQPADAADVKSHARDADHEMSQFLLLHVEMRSERYSDLPEHIRRAIYVAYAIHLRALLEFFHEETSRAAGCRFAGQEPPKKEKPRDIRVSLFSPEAAIPKWSAQAYKRWDEASKLAAHPSRARAELRDLPPFGTPADFRLVGCDILRALRQVPNAADLFPATVAAANEVVRRLPFEAGMCEGPEER